MIRILGKKAVKGKIHYDTNGRYCCNEAVNANPKKLTKDWKKVTCKNCPKVKFYY